MSSSNNISDFLSFLKTLFLKHSIRIEHINDNFVTVDIAPIILHSKGLIIFITPDDIAISIIEQDILEEDSFMPFEKHISNFKEAKDYIINLKNSQLSY